jgi:hypothetical protein
VDENFGYHYQYTGTEKSYMTPDTARALKSEDRIAFYDVTEGAIRGTVVRTDGTWLDVKWDDGIQHRYHVEDMEHISTPAIMDHT